MVHTHRVHASGYQYTEKRHQQDGEQEQRYSFNIYVRHERRAHANYNKMNYLTNFRNTVVGSDVSPI